MQEQSDTVCLGAKDGETVAEEIRKDMNATMSARSIYVGYCSERFSLRKNKLKADEMLSVPPWREVQRPRGGMKYSV